MTDKAKKHTAAYWWEQAAFYDELDAEAVRLGHIHQSIKFADSAAQCRKEARTIECGEDEDAL